MQTKKSITEETVVVIMAAGKGTRMGRSDLALFSIPKTKQTESAGLLAF